MRRAGFALAFLIAAALAPAAEPGPEQVLVRREGEFLDAVRARDIERFLAFWAEDGATFPGGAPIAVGRSAARAQWEGLLADSASTMTWSPVRAEIAGSGDLGYTYGTYEIVRRVDGREVSRRTGKYLTVWRREKDGVWRVAADIGSADPPPAERPKK